MVRRRAAILQLTDNGLTRNQFMCLRLFIAGIILIRVTTDKSSAVERSLPDMPVVVGGGVGRRRRYSVEGPSTSCSQSLCVGNKWKEMGVRLVREIGEEGRKMKEGVWST